MSNVFQLMNQQFPNMFKSPPGENSPAHRGIPGVSPTGQKVVCTPEVSLYQYPTPEMAAVAAASGAVGGTLQRIMEGKELVVESNAGGSIHGPNANVGGGNVINGANGSGGFQCGFCGKSFQQKNTFQNHLRSHREGDDPYQCDICGKTFAVPARLTRHYRTHTGEKPYQCEYCNKSFSVKENLSVHRRIHTKERPYKCEVCERAFEHSGKLHRHMRIHTGERPHRCQICQKTFIQSGQLVIHMRTHTGEKPYVCKVCGKGFTCSKQLKVHTRTHTGEKPYTCDICGKSFGYNHVLKLHQVAHYGEKVYKCTLCNGTFNSKKALETHIKTHSDDHVPPGPGSPNIVTETRVLSPSSLLSQATPPSQNSDKENRECSDSELSSQNSPSSSNDGPKTPPSPMGSFPPSSGTIHLGAGMHQQHPLHLTSTGEHKLGGFSRMSGKANSGSSDGTSSSSMNHSNNSNSNSNSNNSGSNHNSQDKTCSTLPIPYPMLPPGVQIQQAPHSRTTFLYVTSKLPPHPAGLNSNNSSSSSSSSNSSSPPQSPPLRHPQNGFIGLGNNSNASSANTKQQYMNGVVEQKGSAGNDSGNGRNKLLMHKIREKVLQFTEKFGYGLTQAEIQEQQQNAQKKFLESNGGNLKFPSSVGGVSVHPVMVPENLSFNSHFNNNNNSKGYPDDTMYHQNRLRHHQNQFKRERSSSPEIIQEHLHSPSHHQQTSYTPGGVLALALTKGSKAVAAAAAAANSLHHHNIPAKVSLIPVSMSNGSSSGSGLFNNYQSNQLHMQQQQANRLSPRSNSPSSPIDFHHHLQLQQQHHQQNFYVRGGSRPESVSPTRNSLHSPSPNSTPRSTPSLHEDYSDQDTQISGKQLSSHMGELSGDESTTSNSSSSVMAGSKRSRSPNSNSSGGGPRKRSSLILEKYAMENTPSSPALPTTPPPSSNSESILSQRLRLSSVIQYAEKCS